MARGERPGSGRRWAIQPGGLVDGSRGLSAAIPPEKDSQIHVTPQGVTGIDGTGGTVGL